MKAQTHQPLPASTKAPAPRGAALTPPSAGIGFADRLADGLRDDSVEPLQAKLSAAAGALRSAAAAAGESPPLPLPRGGGVPLDASVRGAMEASFDTSFADVRIHRDGAAESLGAIAFTRGADIHFAPGSYSPNTASGRSLLGHELAHVQQQRAGRVPTGADLINDDPVLESEADHLGERAAAGSAALVAGGGAPSTSSAPPIQAKLNWTSQTLKERSGAGNWFRSKAWKRMLKRLDRYNAHANDTKGDIPLLDGLQNACISWIEDHDDELGYEDGPNKKVRESLRGMVERLAYADIPNERGSLSSGLRDGTTGKSVTGGSASSVKRVKFGGDSDRFFKDESSKPGQTIVPYDIGIVDEPVQHPLYGSRAVASWYVDRLLGGGTITRTDFAQRKHKKGLVGGVASETAGGDSIQSLHNFKTVQGQSLTLNTYEETDYDSPELQRQLSTLQVLDAITGQSDRHAGNYFVDLETPQPKVWGIDNDLSFGQKKWEVSGPKAVYSKTANQWVVNDKFKGMPPYVDADFGDRVLSLQESSLREALRPLLPPKAVQAAADRLRSVKLALKKMKQKGRFLTKDDWNKRTSKGHTKSNSYLGATRHLSEASKHDALFVPMNGIRSTEQRRNRKKFFLELREKLEIFRKTPDPVKDEVIRGKSKVFKATSAEDLAEELFTTMEILTSEFKGMGGEGFFEEIRTLINKHLL